MIGFEPKKGKHRPKRMESLKFCGQPMVVNDHRVAFSQKHVSWINS